MATAVIPAEQPPRLTQSLRRIIWVMTMVHAAGCVSLPQNPTRSPSFRLNDTADTALGRTFAAATAAQPGRSGLHPIASGVDAFAARVALADQAQRTLDVQYYIFQEDDTGKLLTDAILRAADRGVRVRVLLDDVDPAGDRDIRPQIEHAHPLAAKGHGECQRTQLVA